MSDIQLLEEENNTLHITGVSGRILSPFEWIKKVQGTDHLIYLDEYGSTLYWSVQLMEWYGDYVGRKVKEQLKG